MGGNQGDVVAAFKEVRLKLSSGFELLKESGLYKTEAWGMENAPDFINQVLVIRTSKSAHEVFAACMSIEKELGRFRKESTEAYQDRPIDIDLLSCNEDVIDTKDLQVPHPRLHKRNFTLAPMLEVMPEWKHPLLNKTVKDLWKASEDTNQVSRV